MNLVTRHTTKLKIMKTSRRMFFAAGGLAMAAASFVMTASTAQADWAGWEPCYNRNGYSFEQQKGDDYSEIYVWRGSGCTGDAILSASAFYYKNENIIKLSVHDYKSDDTGLTLYTHGPALSSDVHTDAVGVHTTYNVSSFSKPYQFWVRVGGKTNSNAEDLPGIK